MYSDASPKLGDSDNVLLFKIAQGVNAGANGITQAAADARYVLKIGDLMSGALNIATSADAPQIKLTTSPGQTTQAFQIFQSDGVTQVFGVNFSGTTDIIRQQADASGASWNHFKRGTVGNAASVVLLGEQISQDNYHGWTGAAFGLGAQILTRARENFAPGAVGTQYDFRACAIGSAAMLDLLVLSSTSHNLVTGDYFLRGVAQLNPISVYASGTAYTLTATNASVDFGTQDPVITVNASGTYRLRGRVKVNLNGATFAANRTLTVKLRRTNNTPADVAGSSTTWTVPITTTITNTLAVIELPEVFYTTAVGTDTIQIFADISVLPSAGTISIDEASITAIRTS